MKLINFLQYLTTSRFTSQEPRRIHNTEKFYTGKLRPGGLTPYPLAP